jgi:hypothetical protein
MNFILAFMMCLPGNPDTAECRTMTMEFTNSRACSEMKREVIAEAKREGFRVTAVCAPLAIETESRATSLPNFPRQ